MTKHRSIGERLKRAKSPDVKQEVALDWAANWQDEYKSLIAQLEKAIRDDDYDNLCIATGQLKAVGEKRHKALVNVLNTLANSGTLDGINKLLPNKWVVSEVEFDYLDEENGIDRCYIKAELDSGAETDLEYAQAAGKTTKEAIENLIAEIKKI